MASNFSKSVIEAEEIDKENKDNRWMEAIKKEMSKIRIAFKVLNDDEDPPNGFKPIGCHLVFDVKMEDFRFKARMCANGNETGTPDVPTYASVVSRESVRIALTYAALNGLEVKTSDIENAYLTAMTTEKLYTKLGPEFGDDAGKRAIIVRAIYGTKTAGAAFRNTLADCMHQLGYKPCLADRDVWMKKFQKPNKEWYWGYILLYVDDACCINHDATSQLTRLDRYFSMKPGSIGDPDMYLGGKVSEQWVRSDDGTNCRCWGISPTKYVRDAIKNVETYIGKRGLTLPKTGYDAPFKRGYRPELDFSKELNAEDSSYYQSQIGILRWMIELGRIDIIEEVAELSTFLALPREGHLEAVYGIYSYLKYKKNSLMLFDPTYPDIDYTSFPRRDWEDFYGEVEEEEPPEMPDPLGSEMIMRLFVDADYAGDNVNRRSRTGFFIFLQNSPIVWFSKKQSRIENSVFGSEFIAMRLGVETVKGLRYKVRMMGIPLKEPTYTYGDNMSVIHNTSKPESVLKKKANSVCYHYVREAVAADEVRVSHIRSEENPADIATKSVPAGAKRDHLVEKVLYFINEGKE